MTAAHEAGPATGDAVAAGPAARDMWRVVEPYHAVVYFAPETREVYAEAGLKGGWMGYFASRSGPMGPVGSEVVVATFHNFAAPMVRRAIPDAWRLSSPERVLEARLRIADTALRRLLGEAVASDEVAEAAELAAAAVAAGDPAGRPLFAAHAALPQPPEPHLALWQACAALREHRFDGHVAVLTGYGVGGLESHLILVGAGVLTRERVQPFRGFTDEEWEAGVARLRERGWLEADGTLSEHGRRLHEALELRTDGCAQPVYDDLGPARTARLHALLAPLSDRIQAGGGIFAGGPLALR